MARNKSKKQQSKTPQPAKAAGKIQTPKSAPPLKRKKLEQEIDDSLSDEDFEALLNGVRNVEKEKVKNGTKTPKQESDVEDSEEDLEFTSGSDDEGDEEIIIGEDDDDEGSDDLENSDDEEEEDDEESEEETEPVVEMKKGKANKKKAAQTSESTKPAAPPSKGAVLQKSFQEERDKRTLLIKPLLNDVTEDEVKLLSKDIVEVRLRRSKKGHRLRRGMAYLEFASEKLAEKNKKLLLGKEVKEKAIEVVDYVGAKSLNKPVNNDATVEYDLNRLYITGLKQDIVEEDLQKLFPGAVITIPRKKKTKQSLGYAFAEFPSEKACSKVYDSAKSYSVKKHPITVLYAKKRNPVVAEKRRNDNNSKDEPKKKKKKVEKQVVEEKEDSDEDEDSEDGEDISFGEMEDDDSDEDGEDGEDDEVDSDDDDDDDDDEQDGEDDEDDDDSELDSDEDDA